MIEFYCAYNYDKCEHCSAEVRRRRNLPALRDCAAWDEIAREHDKGCAFAITRAFGGYTVREQDEESHRGNWRTWLRDARTDDMICEVVE